MTSSTAAAESGARNRTRRAILSAAASVLAHDRAATLSDIAAAADVGRSTLHRYFTDRDELLAAVIDDSRLAIEQAGKDAALDQGTPAEAMRRLVAALVDTGDRLLFLFGDPHLLEGFQSKRAPDTAPGQPRPDQPDPDQPDPDQPDPDQPDPGQPDPDQPDPGQPDPDQPRPADQPVIDLIERGQTEGVFDPHVSAAWIQHVLWALVYTGCEAVGKGELPRHGVTSTVIRTLENGISPPARVDR